MRAAVNIVSINEKVCIQKKKTMANNLTLYAWKGS